MSETTVGLIVPDFSAVKDQVEPGIYMARITNGSVDQWEGKNGKPNTTFINWELETFNEEEEKNNGRKIFHKTPINGGGAFRLQEFYKAALGTPCPTDGFNVEDFYGREVQVTVVDGVDRQTKQPTGYTEVKTVKPLQ